jgi:hypothetical protein
VNPSSKKRQSGNSTNPQNGNDNQVIPKKTKSITQKKKKQSGTSTSPHITKRQPSHPKGSNNTPNFKVENEEWIQRVSIG